MHPRDILLLVIPIRHRIVACNILLFRTIENVPSNILHVCTFCALLAVSHQPSHTCLQSLKFREIGNK